MSEQLKFIEFDQYCPKCKYKDTSDAEDPCDECLTNPVAYNSKKPINFKENKDEKMLRKRS